MLVQARFGVQGGFKVAITDFTKTYMRHVWRRYKVCSGLYEEFRVGTP